MASKKVKRKPTRKQLAARRKFVAMVRARSRALKKRVTTTRASRKSKVNRKGATKRNTRNMARRKARTRVVYRKARRSYRRSSSKKIDLMALGATAFVDPILDSFINRYVPNVLGSVDATQAVVAYLLRKQFIKGNGLAGKVLDYYMIANAVSGVRAFLSGSGIAQGLGMQV